MCHDPSTEFGGAAEIPTPAKKILGRLKMDAFEGFLPPERA